MKKIPILIIVLLVGVVGYFYLHGLPPIKYWTTNPTNFEECKEATRGFIIKTNPPQCEFRGQHFVEQSQGQITNPPPSARWVPIKTERSAWFEGWDKVEFGLSLPSSTSNMKGGAGWLSWLAPDNKSEIILDASYEGGRGYQPKDYFEQEIQKTCPKCVAVGPVSIPHMSGSVYSDGVTEFSVFSPADNGIWLFHARYPASVSSIAKSHLATFWAKNSQKTGEIAEQPLIIYLVKTSGISEEYVPVMRYIAKTPAVGTAVLNELLIGPTLLEEQSGLFSALPLGSKLNSLKIEKSVAYADFDERTQSGGGSTSMALRRGQIEKTLKQFSSISSVVISINGNSHPSEIFQP